MSYAYYTLSKDQLERYTEDGYLIIRRFFDQDLLDTYRKRITDICTGEVDTGKYVLFKQPSLKKAGLQGEAVVNKIQHVETDEVFSTYHENPRLLDVVSQLVGENVMLFHAMAFNKPPGSGQHHPHQEMHYIPLRPCDKIVVTWTAIDHATVDNGCMYMVPGSHRTRELYPHSILPGNDKLYYAVEEEEIRAPIEKRVDLLMAPGDIVLFHPLIIHGSRSNRSKTFRKSISCHYASCECCFIQLEGTPQEYVVKEAEAILRTLGYSEGYTEYYRRKCRVVRGQRRSVL